MISGALWIKITENNRKVSGCGKQAEYDTKCSGGWEFDFACMAIPKKWIVPAPVPPQAIQPPGSELET